VLHWHQVNISKRRRDNGPQIMGLWPWPFWITWRHQSRDHSNPNGPFPLVVHWPKSLSPAVFEIFGHMYFEVTTLTFLDHVTSSVTWPFESQWAISYWCSIGPKSLSLMDSEIFRHKHHVPIGTMLNRHCTCAISR